SNSVPHSSQTTTSPSSTSSASKSSGLSHSGQIGIFPPRRQGLTRLFHNVASFMLLEPGRRVKPIPAKILFRLDEPCFRMGRVFHDFPVGHEKPPICLHSG